MVPSCGLGAAALSLLMEGPGNNHIFKIENCLLKVLCMSLGIQGVPCTHQLMTVI